ncbi:NADH-ubiquinone oxidoreductase Complex1 subunit [Cristinia sonorae]|uniref:NADH-ubiquinone oxidoreductase Complex1 subunit n=1 Tax=Cristinia sonorae TaxID=1940300 RepID=A0A8K0UG54_9AGAR|nr:NADH-ubiquinone oxidoreductase Complex1 subunit [Cristinia sonorae]
MSTIPARLARAAQTSANTAEARSRVLKLYRDWYRAAPEIVSLYTLNVSPAYFRHVIRQEFEANRHVTDLKVIDVLLQKSRVEYQETVNCWKTVDHVMGILLRPKGRPQRTFLQKFYEGRDEDQVLPAATGILHPNAI